MYGDYLKRFAEYDIDNGTWGFSLHDAPCDVDNAASLTTNAAVGGDYRIYAAFSHDDVNDCPHNYVVALNTWSVIDNEDDDPTYNTHFTDNITWGSSMAIGADNLVYLTTGKDHMFYDVDVSPFSGGQQARVVPSGRTKAQAIMLHDGVEIEYQLPAAANVRASLHDALGRRVGTSDAGKQNAGMHRLCWKGDQEGRKLSAGAYFVMLDMGAEQVRLKTVVE
jgi:hypothetical protein